MSAVRLFECAVCGQLLLRPNLPCDCPTLCVDRFLVTPYGQIPAPAEPQERAA